MSCPGSIDGSAVSSPLYQEMQERAADLLKIKHAQQRLSCLVEAARHRHPLPDDLKTDVYRVQGCLVRTWMVPEVVDGLCYFRCDSDAAMLKALLGLLCDVFSGYRPEQIAGQDPELWLKELNVLHQLAENRQRTILTVAAQVREFARRAVAPAV